MRIRLITCEVFYREICHLAAESPHVCDVEFLPRGLHDLGSAKMSASLQASVDTADTGEYDAIVLVYGLCNNGVVGLSANKTKLVIPRAHDCIALFMGGRGQYQSYFDAHPGTWYRTTGWYDRLKPGESMENSIQRTMGLSWERQKLVETYGEENADYILETLGDPTAHYNRLAFIAMGLACEPEYEKQAEVEAKEKGWTYDRVGGTLDLLRKCVAGEWDDDFLVVQPGETIRASHDAGIICAEACDTCGSRACRGES